MFCHKCGTQLPDDSIFCTKCGVKVAVDTNEQINTDASVERELPAEDLSPVDKWLDLMQKKYAEKQYDSAQNYAERVIEIEPDNAFAHEFLFFFLIEKAGASASEFKKYFKEAVDHAAVAAENNPSQSSSYLKTCADTVQNRVEKEESAFQGLSRYSFLPGTSERAQAVKEAARYYYLLEAMVYIFRIPNASRQTAAECYGKMYSMHRFYAILILGEQKFSNNFDYTYNFVKALNAQTLENYPTLNINRD